MNESEHPKCDFCGSPMKLIERDTILGDKYGCKNEICRIYVEDEPIEND